MAKRKVFMFSGQGSHYYHMARELYERHSGFRNHMSQLDEVVTGLIQQSVLEALYDDQRSRGDVFDRTLLTHPAIYMVQCALAQTLQEYGIVPDYLLGASLGSYVAAAIGGCITVQQGLEAVIKQAQILETHCRKGAMLAVLADPQLYESSPFLWDTCAIAGINFRSHFVLSTPLDNLDAVETFFRRQQVVFQRLSVSYAFHSKWVDEAELPCRALMELSRTRATKIPIVCCARANVVQEMRPGDFWDIVRKPILFQKAVECLEDRDDCEYIDLGPSGTLASFVKYILVPTEPAKSISILTPFGGDYAKLQRLSS